MNIIIHSAPSSLCPSLSNRKQVPERAQEFIHNPVNFFEQIRSVVSTLIADLYPALRVLHEETRVLALRTREAHSLIHRCRVFFSSASWSLKGGSSFRKDCHDSPLLINPICFASLGTGKRKRNIIKSDAPEFAVVQSRKWLTVSTRALSTSRGVRVFFDRSRTCPICFLSFSLLFSSFLNGRHSSWSR